jgi:hypothetical protein
VFDSSLLWTLQLPKEHEHVHSLKDIIYICPLCYFTHTSSKQYQKHMTSEHKLAGQDVVGCHLCKEHLDTADDLVSHYTNIHSVSLCDTLKNSASEPGLVGKQKPMEYIAAETEEQSPPAGEMESDDESPNERVLPQLSSVLFVDAESHNQSVSTFQDLGLENTLTDGSSHIEPVLLHKASYDKPKQKRRKKKTQKAEPKHKAKAEKTKGKGKAAHLKKYKKHGRIKCPFCSDFYFTNSQLDVTFPEFLHHLYEVHCDSEHRLKEAESEKYKDTHMWAHLWAKYRPSGEDGTERLGKVYVCPYCEVRHSLLLFAVAKSFQPFTDVVESQNPVTL